MSDNEQPNAKLNHKTGKSTAGTVSSSGGAGQERFQERFNRFIRAENERLNRLIRNLYLHFQLEHYDERELYDRICQEVAEYFRAASCELYIVRYEVEQPNDKDGSQELATFTGIRKNGRRRLTKWLELVGAFGPARRALRQQYVTWRSRSVYEIPVTGPVDQSQIPSWTRRAFVDDNPTRYTSCLEFRAIREKATDNESSKRYELRRDSPRQVIWYQDGLFNSCRCSLAAPLVREGEGGVAGESIPYHRRIGLIKLENRTPYGVTGFSDVPSRHAHQNQLFFPQLWRIVAMRPYVRDLRDSVRRGGDPFFPLHNNVGWQQYFEDHPLGAHYFQQILQELRTRRRDPNHAQVAEALRDNYTGLAHWLETLLESVIRLETWLQHLRFACRLIYGLGERPTLDRPTPSLFNVHNLHAAYTTHLRENTSISAVSGCKNGASPLTEHKRYPYDAVRESLVHCLIGTGPDSGGSKLVLETLASALSAIEIFQDAVDRIHKAISMDQRDAKDLLHTVSCAHKEIIKSLKALKTTFPAKSETIAGFDQDIQIQDLSDVQFITRRLVQDLERALVSAESLQTFARREVEVLIQTLCQQRANAMCQALGIYADTGFDAEIDLIARALGGNLPDWDFEGVLKRQVLGDLQSICAKLLDEPLGERPVAYELIAEEAEARRIAKVVQSILQQDKAKEEQYGVACALPSQNEHEEFARGGCQTARALAAAAMCADSFDQIDEKRLVFIASHIAHVLDSHLLHQASQRDLELDYPALNLLGLDQHGLEMLDTLHSWSQRLAHGLLYLLEREAYYQGVDASQLPGELPSPKLREWVGAIKEITASDASKRELWLSHVLFRIASPVLRTVGPHVLEQVLQHSELVGAQVTANADAEDRLTQLIFHPSTGLTPSGNRDWAEVVLQSNSTGADRANEAETLELLANFQPEALKARDLRALWSAVRAVYEALMAVEMTIGGTQDVKTGTR